MAWTSADQNAQDAADADFARRLQDPVAHKALVADRNAEQWVRKEASRLRRHIANCFAGDSAAPIMWREAAAFTSQLSDLSLWAQRAERVGWVAAKAGYEAYQLTAEYPRLATVDGEAA